MTYRNQRDITARCLLLAVLSGCAAEEPWPPYAGLSIEGLEAVAVIDSRPRLSGTNRGWVVSAEPRLRIGVVEGDPPYQFSRIAGVVRLLDGRILVADGGSNELRLFSAEGHHLRTVGGSGQGPGEFQQILWVKRLGSDRILAWDGALQRGTVFTAEGEHVETLPLPEVPGHSLLFPENAFIDGSLLTQAGPPSETVDDAGRVWKVVTVHRTGLLPASAPALVGTFPSHLPQEEDVWPKWQVGGDLLVYARGDLAEVLVLDPKRGAPRVLREGQAVNRGQDLATYYDQLQVDDRGSIWARKFDEETWIVFNASGETYTEFHQPPGVVIHQISDNELIGVERSDLGVESVVVYDLRAL